jgi:hypothetical protein
MAGRNPNKGKAKAGIGADDVYPLIIYALLKGNITKLKSNLNYIKAYRHATRLESKEEYYFTTVYTAVGFIESMKHSDLSNLKENDFLRFCKEQDDIEYERMKNPKNIFKSNFFNKNRE